jgi:hypothetical protein
MTAHVFASVLFLVSVILFALGLLVTLRPRKNEVKNIKPAGEYGGSTEADLIERRFKNVFSLVPPDRRESIVNHYTSQFGCTRADAMNMAMEQQSSDALRWH